MPRFGQINDDTFDDLLEEGISHYGVYIYLFYSVTSKNLIGLYRTQSNRDRVSMGYPKTFFKKGKKELEEKGKILWENGFVWIVGKANQIANNKQLIGARNCLRELRVPQPLLDKFVKKYPNIGYPIDRVSRLAAPIPTPIPTSKKRNNISPDFFQRANLLKDKILQNNPKAKITDSQIRKWGDVVRLMVD